MLRLSPLPTKRQQEPPANSTRQSKSMKRVPWTELAGT